MPGLWSVYLVKWKDKYTLQWHIFLKSYGRVQMSNENSHKSFSLLSRSETCFHIRKPRWRIFGWQPCGPGKYWKPLNCSKTAFYLELAHTGNIACSWETYNLLGNWLLWQSRLLKRVNRWSLRGKAAQQQVRKAHWKIPIVFWWHFEESKLVKTCYL